MRKKKLISKKKALSWMLALTLAGSSLTMPVQAADFTDEISVESIAEDDSADVEEIDADKENSEDNTQEEDSIEAAEDTALDGAEISSDDTVVFEDEESAPAAGEGTAENPHLITTAEELPSEIPSGSVYALGNDITLASGQQITSIAGTLDGKGHVITLADKPLAGTVSGTIQNLGVAGSQTLSLSDAQGSMAVTVTETGVIQNSYCTVASEAASAYMDTIG